MMEDASYQAARRRVMRRLILQISFVANLLFYLLIILDILLTPRANPVLGALIFGLFWGTILVVHAVYAFNLFSRRIHQAALRELEHETPREKPKRQAMQLGDDGELLDLQQDTPETRQSSSSQ